MKKISCFLIMVVTIMSFNYAQKPPVKYGQIDIADLTMATYPGDTSAPAVILCDYGRFSSTDFQFTRILRIKILKKEGLYLADQVFRNDESSSLRGKTYNYENGEIVEDKLKPESIYKERITQDRYLYKVAMPNVRVGSIIEIEYSHLLIPYVWRFQSDIPVRWSELRLESSPYIDFRKNYTGSVSFFISESERWVAKDVPAFKEEAYTSSVENYITKFDFDILNVSFPGYYKAFTTSWDAVGLMLMEDDYFGDVMSGNMFLNYAAEGIKKSNMSDEEKIKEACKIVKTIKWDERERLYTTYTTLSTCYDKHIGNSADINMALISLLNKINIPAHPVIMSSRSNGLLPFFPTLEKLNYVICYANIKDKEYLIDATEELLPMNLIPERSINGSGRILYKDGTSKPVIIKTSGKDKKNVVCNLVIEEDLTLTGKINSIKYDYAAFDFRKSYREYESQDMYLEDMESEYPGLRVNSMSIDNLDSIYKPVSEHYEISLRNAVSPVGDMYYITPLLFYKTAENPFKVEIREYPVDFPYPQDETYIIEYTIPENMELVEAPKPVKIALPENAGSVFYNVAVLGKKITISYKFAISKTMFATTEYKNLKEFFDLIIKKQAEPIILKKI